MYVRKYDPETRRRIDKKEFTMAAKKCVSEEVQMYMKIYPELKDRVWTQKLANHFCVIMPFFAPVPKRDRLAIRDEVKEILLNKFALEEESYRYKSTDQSWRHIGRLNDVLYLFDLADLEKVTNGKGGTTQKAYEYEHWKALERKAMTRTG
jgi:hypothetical protein